MTSIRKIISSLDSRSNDELKELIDKAEELIADRKRKHPDSSDEESEGEEGAEAKEVKPRKKPRDSFDTTEQFLWDALNKGAFTIEENEECYIIKGCPSTKGKNRGKLDPKSIRRRFGPSFRELHFAETCDELQWTRDKIIDGEEKLLDIATLLPVQEIDPSRPAELCEPSPF